ncbi:cytochrome P450 oxidoreductase/alkane hydroxylase [Aspergillus sclerotioniger CBS 115572]|uniref:Cytochrome P450 oxidoreductase/alkane hydroxylase n=1 Tax=Aspergillus sclerotioniger CBS 115572 TaxID=1450535 RepID=A0A317VJP1_9EURO|nr:cytochrome P450 oxidoreductase/alkane hydroxylase [Aspergillus sclerotioniger CBS 115572]PWY73072.1 cytochrome P450 oxidoreductase/alkane hydroxylase [Aspergillus sclerotioniger CBS 115572]
MQDSQRKSSSMLVHSPFGTSVPGSLITAFAAAAVGVIIIFLAKGCHRIKQLRGLEQIHGCKKPPNESDRFRYDFFGIVKAIELAFHFRNRTSLPYTNALFEKYGETYASNVLGYRLLFTCNAGNIKHLLSTAFVDFDSSPPRRPLFEPITPHGIFTLDGADWKISREQLRSQLSNLRKAIDLNLCEQHFLAFCQHVPPNGQVFDIQSRVFALSLDIQTLFSLGESVDALSFTQSQEKVQFVEHLLLVKERIVQDGFRGPLRHLSSKRGFLQSCKRAREYVMVRVIRKIQRQNRVDGEPGERHHYKTDISVNVDQVSRLTDQCLSILLANDSMSTTLSGLFFCLSQNERVVRKLRASILETIGSTPPTWGQLGRLHYVRWVLQEAMRLFPPVVLNARVANKNSTLPNGGESGGNSPILVMKGDIVVFSTWARHRLGEDFGKDPEAFYPERWEQLSGDMSGFIPFNKGPRTCPGQHYAMIVLTYIVARMFQTFSTVSNYNTRPWKERISMTFENENGVLVGLS